jgi:hypothetical protein
LTTADERSLEIGTLGGFGRKQGDACGLPQQIEDASEVGNRPGHRRG